MKNRKSTGRSLIVDVAFVAAIALLNRCFERGDATAVKGNVHEGGLNRKLTMVSLVYHAIGVFYNE